MKNLANVLHIVKQKQLHTNFLALEFDEILWPTDFVLCDLDRDEHGTFLKYRRYRYFVESTGGTGTRYLKVKSTAGNTVVLLSVLFKKSSRKKVLPYILLIFK